MNCCITCQKLSKFSATCFTTTKETALASFNLAHPVHLHSKTRYINMWQDTEALGRRRAKPSKIKAHTHAAKCNSYTSNRFALLHALERSTVDVQIDHLWHVLAQCAWYRARSRNQLHFTLLPIILSSSSSSSSLRNMDVGIGSKSTSLTNTH